MSVAFQVSAVYNSIMKAQKSWHFQEKYYWPLYNNLQIDAHRKLIFFCLDT